MKEDALALMRDIPILSIEPETAEVVDTYISHRLMPGDVRGDALHLAVASLHGCHYLLTWNCAHLANANKIEHIRHVNNMLGLYVPIITTPVELLM